MINYTPYIVFALGVISSFCVWLVKENYDRKIENASLKNIIDSMKTASETERSSVASRLEALKSENKSHREENDYIKEKMNEINMALAVAKNNMEMLMLKFLKTKTA